MPTDGDRLPRDRRLAQVDLTEAGAGNVLKPKGKLLVVDQEGLLQEVGVEVDQQMPLEEGGVAVFAIVAKAAVAIAGGGHHLLQPQHAPHLALVTPH